MKFLFVFLLFFPAFFGARLPMQTRLTRSLQPPNAPSSGPVIARCDSLAGAIKSLDDALAARRTNLRCLHPCYAVRSNGLHRGLTDQAALEKDLRDAVSFSSTGEGRSVEAEANALQGIRSRALIGLQKRPRRGGRTLARNQVNCSRKHPPASPISQVLIFRGSNCCHTTGIWR